MLAPDARAQGPTERKIEFHQRYYSETIYIEGEGCQAVLDDPSNFEVDDLGGGQFRVRSLRLRESSSVLLIDCGEQQYFYVLSFKNADLTSVRTEGSQARYARPNSSYGSQVGYAPSDGTTLTVSLADSSWEKLQIFASESFAFRPQGNNFKSTSLDFLHTGNASALGYGLTQEFRNDDRLITVRASSTVSRFSLLGNRRYRNGKFLSETYSASLPDPVRIRYTHVDNREQQESSDSIARDFFFAGREVRNNASVQFTNGRRVSEKYNAWSWNNAFDYDLTLQVSHQINSNFVCEDSDQCLVQSFGNALTHRGRGGELRLGYSLLPHDLNLSANADVTPDFRLFGTVTKKLNAIAALQKIRWFARDGVGADADAASNARIGAAWRDLSGALTVGQSQILSAPTSTAGVELAFDQPDYRIDGAFSYATSKMTPRKWEVRAGYKRYFDPGLKALALQLEVHELSGFVLSNFERQPVAGAEVTLKQPGEADRVVTTDETGKYAFYDIAGSGNVTLATRIKRPLGDVVSEVSFTKALTSVKAIQDLTIESFAFVPVRFFFDVTGRGTFDTTIVRTDLENYNELVEGGVVMIQGAKHMPAGIILARGERYEAQVTPEFLPMGIAFVAAEGLSFDLGTTGSHEIRVLVRKAAP